MSAAAAVAAAAPVDEYVLHIAGPMISGVQRCTACREVLADENQLDVPPGSTRYARGGRVLVLNGREYFVRAPLQADATLPPLTRLCTPTPATTEDTP